MLPYGHILVRPTHLALKNRLAWEKSLDHGRVIASPNRPFQPEAPSNSIRIPSYPGSTFGGSLARNFA
jgi:hypothetical protein